MSGFNLDTVVARHSDAVIETEVNGDIIALNVETALCYGLNRVGSRVWRLLATPWRVGDLHDRLMAEFEVEPATCERELLELLADLDSEGLIRRVSGAPPK